MREKKLQLCSVFCIVIVQCSNVVNECFKCYSKHKQPKSSNSTGKSTYSSISSLLKSKYPNEEKEQPKQKNSLSSGIENLPYRYTPDPEVGC